MKEENGPLIALIAFIVLSVLFGFLAYRNYADLTDPAANPDAKIKDLQKEIEQKRGEVANLTQEAAKFRRQIRAQVDEYIFYSAQFPKYQTGFEQRRELLKTAETYGQEAVDLSGKVSAKKAETLTKLHKETSETRDTMEKDIAEKSTRKDQAVARIRQLDEDFKLDTKKFTSNKNYAQSSLDDSKNILSELTQREVERADVFSEADGHVILADPVNRLVVIDIGTSTGVKNGWRFECFTIRPGNQRVHKAWLEVRHADATKSECLVVTRQIEMPKDPGSEYVAQDPEEMFSPYTESGRKGATAQRLTNSKTVAIGMPKYDPIVEGDLIQNPFFSPGKTYTFYIAGAKDMENEVQKSAIRYRWTEIKQVIEYYGGKVSPIADLNVNYVIAQKNAKSEDPEFQKAIDRGLPVIYEWELFRFLDMK